MPNCMICKRPAHSGYVLCSNCAKSLEPDSLSPELAFVLEHLAEAIVLSTDIYACFMCKEGKCPARINGLGGLACRTGVKNWLTDKAGEYLAQFSERERV